MQKNKKKQRYNAFHITKNIVEIIINVIFLLIWGVTMLTPYVSPLKSQIPAFLNLGFPLILFFFVLMWLGYLVRRKWIHFALYTLLGIISSGFIFTSFPIHLGSRLSSSRDVRVMTYNVAQFSLHQGGDENYDAIELIKSYKADIVCLQEAGIYGTAKKDRAFFREKFGDDYKYIKSQPNLRLLLLTNYPVLKSEEVKYPSQTNGSWMYLLQLPNYKTLLLINNHMESYALQREEKERYKNYLKDFSFDEIPEQTLEVKRRLGPMLNKRAYAAERVKEQIERYKKEFNPNYVIVLGDLNDVPMSYTYKQIRANRRDAFADCGFGLGISFNERFLPFRIDHMFYEGPLKAKGCDLPRNKKASDHNPLIVDFEFETENEQSKS